MNNEHKPLYYMPLCKKNDCGDENCFECPLGDKIQQWQDENNRVYMPLNGFCFYGQRED